MNRSLLVLFVCLAVLSQHSYAEKKAKIREVESAAWAKEPDSFLGIKFGEPLPSNMRYCPDYDSIKADSSICLKATNVGGFFKVENTPDLGFWYDTLLKLEDGKPKWFSITSLRRDFDKLEAAFFNRYGTPTSRSVQTVKTLGGAEFSSQEYLWSGKKVQIDMAERSRKVDESSVMISDRELTLQTKQKEQEISRKGASKF